MTVAEETLLSLIRISLFGSSEIALDGIDWDEVISEAQLQSVAGLISNALPMPIRDQGRKYLYQNTSTYSHILYAQRKLLDMFENAGIPLVILKGFAAAIYYPVPALRSMGDIDFLVPQERFADAVSLMESNGYVTTQKGDVPKERHVGFVKDRILFELHHHFSYTDLDIEEYLLEGLKHLEIQTIDNSPFPMLPKLANGLVLLAHMRAHLQSGLGLRQVIDWMMYVDKVLDDVFWEREFKKAAQEVGLEKLAIVTTHMCQMYLGLSERITWSNSAEENLCSRLMDSLLSSGNFGRKIGDSYNTETVGTFIRKEGFFHYLQRAGECNWEAYKQHHWLKPFCWVYQTARYCRKGLKANRGRELVGGINRSKKRYELLRELNI